MILDSCCSGSATVCGRQQAASCQLKIKALSRSMRRNRWNLRFKNFGPYAVLFRVLISLILFLELSTSPLIDRYFFCKLLSACQKYQPSMCASASSLYYCYVFFLSKVNYTCKLEYLSNFFLF